MLRISASGSLYLSHTCMNCQIRDIFVKLVKCSPGGIWIELLATMQNHCSLCRVISSLHCCAVEWSVWMIETKPWLADRHRPLKCDYVCCQLLPENCFKRLRNPCKAEVFWYRGQNVSFSVHVLTFKNITPALRWDICLRIKRVFEWHISDGIVCICLI